MANNPIPIPKQEKIVNLSDQGYAIRRIAKKTETCRPTVRKYIEIGVQYPEKK